MVILVLSTYMVADGLDISEGEFAACGISQKRDMTGVISLSFIIPIFIDVTLYLLHMLL